MFGVVIVLADEIDGDARNRQAPLCGKRPTPGRVNG
jgi:hypothetical protein